MTLPLTFRPEVQKEIDSAYTWYEQRRIGLGDEFMDVLRDHLESIQQNPELYAKLYRSVRASLLQRFPYVVYFRVESDQIRVIGIQHGRQNPRRWRSRAQ